MARIRTVKPDFFTSDDICALSPLARLLYIGMWCEADREGRMAWAPKAFKRRYLPDDDCDIDQLCHELLARDLVRLYGEDLAFIPTFLEHQHVNPREAASVFPPPDNDAPVTREPRVSDAQVGKEGKEREGKEGNGKRVSHASALPDDWQPSDEDRTWAGKARPDLTPALLDLETERFHNHCKTHERTAHNWGPAWRNWISRADAASTSPRGSSAKADATSALPVDRDSESQWAARMRGYRPGAPWWNHHEWGPEPGQPGCRVPTHLIGGTA